MLSLQTNNLGNIRVSSSYKWHGQIGEKNGFVVFDSLENGLRALLMLLFNYYRKHKCYNVDQITARYAPASENNLGRYRLAVRSVLPDNMKWRNLALDEMKYIAVGIIFAETSIKFPLSVINEIREKYIYLDGTLKPCV